MDLYVAANARLEIFALRLRQICPAVQFQIFSALAVGKLLFVDIFDGMKHFIERVADDEKLLCILGNSQCVVEAAIEESVLCVKFQNLSMVERIGEIVLHKFFIAFRVIHFLALLYKPIL